MLRVLPALASLAAANELAYGSLVTPQSLPLARYTSVPTSRAARTTMSSVSSSAMAAEASVEAAEIEKRSVAGGGGYEYEYVRARVRRAWAAGLSNCLTDNSATQRCRSSGDLRDPAERRPFSMDQSGSAGDRIRWVAGGKR